MDSDSDNSVGSDVGRLTTEERHSVFLVDDHPVVREGLQWRINREADLVVVGSAGSVVEAFAGIAAAKPHIALLDLSVGGVNGIKLIKDVARMDPRPLILVVSIHDELLWAERALRAGASGYIMKSQAPAKMIKAIRTILAGEIWVSDQVNAHLLYQVQPSRRQPKELPERVLTDRELEVLLLIGKGLGPTVIAAQLNVVVRTVEAHRENIRKKLRLHTTAELIRYAVTHL